MTPEQAKQRMVWVGAAVAVIALFAGLCTFTEFGQFFLALVGLS